MNSHSRTFAFVSWRQPPISNYLHLERRSARSCCGVRHSCLHCHSWPGSPFDLQANTITALSKHCSGLGTNLVGRLPPCCRLRWTNSETQTCCDVWSATLGSSWATLELAHSQKSAHLWSRSSTSCSLRTKHCRLHNTCTWRHFPIIYSLNSITNL